VAERIEHRGHTPAERVLLDAVTLRAASGYGARERCVEAIDGQLEHRADRACCFREEGAAMGRIALAGRIGAADMDHRLAESQIDGE